MADHPDLARLPGIDRLLDASDALLAAYGRGPVTVALRTAVAGARERLLAGEGPTPDETGLLAQAAAWLAQRRPGPPQRVVNATGVVLHTNLGRAALGEEAVVAMVDAAGYCDVEYDLDSGGRGSRHARLGPLLADACAAEAGFAVNNAAGALVLALAALAAGREVPVSRGELIEIGGSFRLPDIMAASGARLVEVGTTNRTRAQDYRVEAPALLLKVHPSNYRVSGFTEAPDVAELAAVARDLDIPLVYDIGSGLLADRRERWLADEPSATSALAAGADLVIFSGDKLLGGPQAGILAGRADLVDRCRRHPLARALRLDKLRVAALVATLGAHARGDMDALPTWRALTADEGTLRQRAARLAAAVGGAVVDGAGLVGGGTAPGAEIPGPVVRLDSDAPDDLAARLRSGAPPVAVRVGDGGILLDPRTIAPDEDDLVAARVREARSA